jgi:Tfp pilus assembly protein PilN
MVQVIPKTTRAPGDSFRRIVPWFSLILVVVVIGLYFWFEHQFTIAEETYKVVSDELRAAEKESDKALETRIKLFKERSEDLFKILEKRLLTSVVFDFIEANIHPDVYFTDLTFNQNSKTLELSGSALDYNSLGAQMAVLDNDNFITNIKLNRVSLNSEGNIDFSFEIELVK